MLGGVKLVGISLLAIASVLEAWAWEPRLPSRPVDAPGGAELARRLSALTLNDREEAIVAEVLKGNVPTWWRHFADVPAGPAVWHVAPDYLVVGADEDFLRLPLTPNSAQRLADALDCTLPTTKLVDAIYQAAPLKLEPQPLPPGPEMTTLAQFVRHNDLIEAARRSAVTTHPAGTLVAGHKKDVVLTPQLAETRERVAIYGWHRSSGEPIQPLFLRHAATWVDYSHGIRFVAREVGWGSGSRRIDDLARDDHWWTLMSDEGPFAPMRFGEIKPQAPEFEGEKWEAHFYGAGVRALVGRPTSIDPAKPMQLLVYAVPAGNTIEQTLGRHLRAEDDWHFDIQHIAAQTRWLRANGHPNLVLAVVAPLRGSWTAWTKDQAAAGKTLAAVLEDLRHTVPGARLTLAGHSAGGSTLFSLLDEWGSVPDDVECIALLDANYRYDPSRGHAAKLADWLRSKAGRRLIVLAYEDFRARLDGKPFVTEAGGTWGRSQAMMADLAKELGALTVRETGLLEDARDASGRAFFLLRRNPEGAVWHTRLVELNGLIHAWKIGTAGEARGYEYLGARAYRGFIGH